MIARRYSHNPSKSPSVEHETDNWGTRALCRADPEAWFAEDAKAIRDAKDNCERCPVLNQCTMWAADVAPSDGVWAGRLWINGAAVDRNRRRLGISNPAECGTEQGYQAHRQQVTDKCAACKAAHVAYEAARVRTKREEQAVITVEAAARSVA